MVKVGILGVQATNTSASFEVITDGTGVVGHAGALRGELADRVGLTTALGWRDPRGRHPDGAVLGPVGAARRR